MAMRRGSLVVQVVKVRITEKGVPGSRSEPEAILRIISICGKPKDAWPLETKDLATVMVAIKDCPEAIKSYFVSTQRQ